MTCKFLSTPQTTALWNHSQLQNLLLKNVAIYPSDFKSTISDGSTLYWSNINFMPIGDLGYRVWEFQGSGYSESSNVEISYAIASSYLIGFEGPVSGTITTENGGVLNGASTIIQNYQENNQIIISILIRSNQPLKNFGFTLFKNDNQSGTSSPPTYAVTSLAGNGSGTYLAGLLITRSQNYNIAYSNSITNNPPSWTVVSATSTSSSKLKNSLGLISSVAYFGGYWFALNSSGGYYIQANGSYSQWTKCNINNSSSSLKTFVVGGGYIITYSTSGIYFSSDGTTWNSTLLSESFCLSSISSLDSLCYAGSYFIVAGSYSSSSITNYALMFSKSLAFSICGSYSLSFPNSPGKLQVAAGVNKNSKYYILINAPRLGLYMYSASDGSYFSDLKQITGSPYLITTSKVLVSSIEWTGSYFIALDQDTENVIVCCPTSTPQFIPTTAPLSISATYYEYLMGDSFATTTLTNACTNPTFTTPTTPTNPTI
jgi:hypothetical protein